MSGRPRRAVVRTCGHRKRPPALCPLFSWYPLACVKGSLPFDRSLWHGPPLRRTGDGPSVASARRTQETRLAAPGPEAPRTTPNHPEAPPRQPQPADRRPPRTFAVPSAHISWDIRPSPRQVRMPRRARPLLPQQARPRASRLRRGCAPAPHLRRPFRAYILGYAFLSPTGSDAPPRVSAPAAAGASRPLALRRGQEGSAPSPAGKAHPAPTFSAAPTSAQPPFSSRSRSPWHTAPRRWCGCHGRDTAAGRARFGRGRIRSG